jgi:hypothetical protein
MDLSQLQHFLSRVIAVGSGEGDLLAVSLELPDDCHDKHVEPLAISPVYVHVNLDSTKRDRNNNNNNNVYKIHRTSGNHSSHNSGKRNRKKGERRMHNNSNNLYSHSIGPNNNGNSIVNNNNKGMSSMKSVDMGDLSEILSNIALRDDNSRDNADRGPPYRPPHNNNNLLGGQQPSLYGGYSSSGLHPHETATTLEVGMYILLGVFCVAIAVFMASCFVYASKHNNNGNNRLATAGGHHHPGLMMMHHSQQQHHHHKSHSVQNAHDWVWLGRHQSTTLDGSSKRSVCPSLATSGSRDDGLLLAAAGTVTPGASNSLLSRELRREPRLGGDYFLHRDPASRPPHFGGFVNGQWVGGGDRDFSITANPSDKFGDLGDGAFSYGQRERTVGATGGVSNDFYAELPRHHHHHQNHHRRSPRANRRRRQQQQEQRDISSANSNMNNSVESVLRSQQQQQYQQQQQRQMILPRSTFRAIAATQKSPESSQQKQLQQQQHRIAQQRTTASSSSSSCSPSPSIMRCENQNITTNNNRRNSNSNDEDGEEVVASPRPSINSATYTRQKPVLESGGFLPVGYPVFCSRGAGGFQNPWEALHHGSRGGGGGGYSPPKYHPADRHFFQVVKICT